MTFDDGSLVSDAGLLVAGTLMSRIGLERLLDDTVRMGGRAGGSRPGRKILSLVASMLVGGSHIDHADRLRAGSTHRVLPFRVMAPSTLGTFLRSFTWGHVRQLDKALGETLRRVWSQIGHPDGNRSLWMWIPPFVRFRARPKRAPLMGTPHSWDTTPFWPCPNSDVDQRKCPESISESSHACYMWGVWQCRWGWLQSSLPIPLFGGFGFQVSASPPVAGPVLSLDRSVT